MNRLFNLLSRLHFLGAVLFLSIVVNPSGLAQDNTLAHELLAQMSQAVRERDFRGKFTFEIANSAIETYEVSHRVIDGEEEERLERLNGQQKVVVRDGTDVNCLAVGDKILRGRMGDIHPSDQLFHNYSLYFRGEQRIAGRQTYLLQLIPHDGFRNGQTIAVDKESFLPLQKQWFSPDNKLIERMQYVDLDISPTFEDSDFSNEGNPVALQSVGNVCVADEDESMVASWVVNWLPKGFFLTKVGRTTAGESMLTYTDGLASFSVFVQEQPVSVLVEGKSDRGATLAFVGNRTWNKNPFRVTVIGEIPLITAKKVVAGLEPSSIN